MPSIILLLLLIIEFLSHYRKGPKLIEAKHAVQADCCPVSSDNTGHLGTLTRRLHSLSERRHVRIDGQKEHVHTQGDHSSQGGIEEEVND